MRSREHTMLLLQDNTIVLPSLLSARMYEKERTTVDDTENSI